MKIIDRTRTWTTTSVIRAGRIPRPGTFIMTAVLLTLGFYWVFPIVLMFIYSFNVAAHPFIGTEWSLDNWIFAFQRPGLVRSIGNTFLIWGVTIVVSLPVGVVIAWILARARIPWSNGAEFMFWISYMIPGLATTIGWITLMDPRLGMFNDLIELLPFVDQGPFNIFSVPGIVWANLMANGISVKVMLLTPAFRNMDAALEEAATVAGASTVRTAVRVTLPLMAAPMTLVFALQMLKMFQGFESELLLGTPIGFFVYSTYLFDLVSRDPPLYGQAIVLAMITMVIIVFIIPLQRWMLHRRLYTTISSGFKPGLIDLGIFKYPSVVAIWVLISILTLAPVASLLLGSVMVRAGYWNLNRVFTLDHWRFVLGDHVFLSAGLTTLTIAVIAAILSPLLFSLLGYILVRTKLPMRGVLDWMVWGSGAIPGMLAGLGLLVMFLGVPGLSFLFGTIWALILVVVISGNTTGVNIMKGMFVQIGQDMEDAARVAGAGWVRTYFMIWIPLMIRPLTLLATMNFSHAAGTTASIILLASRDTTTLSILALRYRIDSNSQEGASIVALFILLLTVGSAAVIRILGLRQGIRHQ